MTQQRGSTEMSKQSGVILARVKNTDDKIRIRFCIKGFTTKMQEIIKGFLIKMWQKNVTIVKWPRSNVVELKLSRSMIRSAGFLEVAQEFAAYWNRFIQLVEKQVQITNSTHQKA